MILPVFDRANWHDWFAFLPVVVTDGQQQRRVWLRRIKRRVVQLDHVYPRFTKDFSLVVGGRTFTGKQDHTPWYANES